MIRPTHAEIRRLLLSELGGSRLRDGIWRDLVHSRYVELVAEGTWTIERLAQVYLTKEEDLYPPKRKPRHRTAERKVAPRKRGEALSLILAVLLDVLLREAIAFHEKYFDGNYYLSLKEAVAWIEAQAEREGPVMADSMVVPVDSETAYRPLPPGREGRDNYLEWLARETARVSSDPNCELPRLRGAGSLRLSYPTPSWDFETIQIRGDGALAELKAVADTLRDSYPAWDEPAALLFILTELVPAIPLSRTGVRFGLMPATSHIDLMVSSQLSPREVAALYANTRRGLAIHRDRSHDYKHLALAVFAGRQVVGQYGSWPQLRDEWNRLYPEMAYQEEKDPQARAFSLAVRSAWKAVTGLSWRDRRKERY